jgi:putative addiction module killer protein
MTDIRKTDVFARWLDALRDVRARARVLVRIERLAAGNAGDTKVVGKGVCEMRIDHGPGYRGYFTRCHGEIIVLLAGGSKASQAADIRTAQRMAAELREDSR